MSPLTFVASLSTLTATLTLAQAQSGDFRPGNPWFRLSPMDKDGDSKISKAEFTGPERLFPQIDSDADGFVTRTEAEAWKRSPAPSGGPRSGTAPKIGDPAPSVKAKSAATGEIIDLASPKKTTVLVFGSHT